MDQSSQNLKKAYLYASICLLSLTIPSYIYNGIFIFPIDDPYITINQALRFANGEFFTYSSGEPHINANTSFLYYLLVTFAFSLLKILGVSINSSNIELNTILIFLILGFIYFFIFEKFR